MCTAIVSVDPAGPVLLAGVRDELVDRAWEPPGQHWPDHPGLIGGRDLQAGGTWLAVAPAARRVACVLNARGQATPEGSRQTRGVLPLRAADHGKLEGAGLAVFDPFLLIIAEPGRAVLCSWDGVEFGERELPAGLHMVVNSGLDSELRDARDHEQDRLAYYLPRLRAAPRPLPRPGDPVPQAWGAWLPLLEGDGLGPEDPRALIVRRDLGDGRIWGTTSISLVALSHAGVRYDFIAAPGDRDAWRPVPV
jgi:Transport and Golgi organisation 2